MSIAKGSEWGEAGVVPRDAVICTSDAEAASASGAVTLLRAGDLFRGLGEPRAKAAGDECRILPVDLMRVTVEFRDGASISMHAVAHVCLGRFAARDGFDGLVNAGFVDGANLAPRGHPGDGRIELVTMEPNVSWRQRRMARRRTSTGTHVPHPAISVSTVVEWEAETDSRELRVDGVLVTGSRRVSVVLDPGRVRVAV